MKSLLIACCLSLSVFFPLSAQVAPKAPADTLLTPDEAKKLQTAIAKATDAPEAKAADDKLRKAREELAKATQAYQASVEKAAIEADPTTAPVIEKARRLQQEAVARRDANKGAGPTALPAAQRQAQRIAPPAPSGQPSGISKPASTIPRPSELFDNWTAVGLLVSLCVIAMLLLRKRS